MSFFSATPRAEDHKSITSGPYTITISDNIIACNHSSALTINLPSASSMIIGKIFTITDESGDASTNNITITPDGSDTINGETSIIISGNYDSFEIYCGTTTKWFIK